MEVTFVIPGPLRCFAEGQREITMEPSRPVLWTALEELWLRCPGMRDRVLTEQSQVREHINIFIGNENIRDVGGLDAQLRDGVEITILPAISGGCVSEHRVSSVFAFLESRLPCEPRVRRNTCAVPNGVSPS
jgi:sulfur-carrier protein